MRRVMFPSATTVKRVSARGGSLPCRGGDHPKLLKAELLVSSCVCVWARVFHSLRLCLTSGVVLCF